MADHQRDLAFLVQLCRELIKFGIHVGMSDARPAVSVRGGLTGRRVWIQIDASGESFVWRRDDRAHHSVDDPASAAACIAEYLKIRDAGPGQKP
ncbi:hypothetical protein NE236_33370 [Actinoallomurus purpureus]|uniref:hypothetical protein n=1 Tax=Actinoallomurus purpureus TaxID=478114 RepID=UPI002093247E|nr:hypothetical protein [Actinoallomurus purpureus]MCO6009873.1 hypothetical protein [Actinoallomurus purpureus]